MPNPLPLWPGTPPWWNPADDRPQPVLEFYPHPAGTRRPCVLICPGGGYGCHAPHEDIPFRAYFHDLGCHAAVLRYRVQFPAQPRPLGKGPFADAEKAMQTLHNHAGDWEIDSERIGIIGFSAGAHLAGCLTVHGRGNTRPSAAILCYGVLVSKGYQHRGSMENLCGKEDAENLAEFFDLPRHVTRETPPVFVWHTAEDTAVPVENSYEMAHALAHHRIPHALHVFPKGRHGLGLAADEPLTSAWPGLCGAWLRQLWQLP